MYLKWPAANRSLARDPCSGTQLLESHDWTPRPALMRTNSSFSNERDPSLQHITTALRQRMIAYFIALREGYPFIETEQRFLAANFAADIHFG